MNRPIPHYSEMSSRQGLAVEAAYKARLEAVKAKTQEIATNPLELSFMVDDDAVTTLLADLMCEFYQGWDVKEAAYGLCKALDYLASMSAELEVPEVDEEAIEAQLRGDR